MEMFINLNQKNQTCYKAQTFETKLCYPSTLVILPATEVSFRRSIRMFRFTRHCVRAVKSLNELYRSFLSVMRLILIPKLLECSLENLNKVYQNLLARNLFILVCAFSFLKVSCLWIMWIACFTSSDSPIRMSKLSSKGFC